MSLEEALVWNSSWKGKYSAFEKWQTNGAWKHAFPNSNYCFLPQPLQRNSRVTPCTSNTSVWDCRPHHELTSSYWITASRRRSSQSGHLTVSSQSLTLQGLKSVYEFKCNCCDLNLQYLLHPLKYSLSLCVCWVTLHMHHCTSGAVESPAAGTLILSVQQCSSWHKQGAI